MAFQGACEAFELGTQHSPKWTVRRGTPWNWCACAQGSRELLKHSVRGPFPGREPRRRFLSRLFSWVQPPCPFLGRKPQRRLVQAHTFPPSWSFPWKGLHSQTSLVQSFPPKKNPTFLGACAKRRSAEAPAPRSTQPGGEQRREAAEESAQGSEGLGVRQFSVGSPAVFFFRGAEAMSLKQWPCYSFFLVFVFFVFKETKSSSSFFFFGGGRGEG